MFYPVYPRLSSFEDSVSLSYLMSIYDKLTAIGLYVVPRKMGTKIPLSQYWRKTDRKIATRYDVEKSLYTYQADALCVVTGQVSGRLVVLDFDTAEIEAHEQSASALYNYFQHLSPNAFVILTPAAGVHMYYRIPEHLKLPHNGKIKYPGIDVRGEGGQVVTVGGTNIYTKDADKKGVPENHQGVYQFDIAGYYKEIPEMTEALYNLIFSEPLPDNPEYPKAEIDRNRIDTHVDRDTSEKIQLTLECLSYALKDWNPERDYDEWLRLWMSAHHASEGDKKVRDYILDHPNVYWRDNEDGKDHFIKAWDGHQQQENGYTVASLFWLARQQGWLSETGYEIANSRTRKISTRYITDWLKTLDVIPERLLLESQTGSGKTYAINYIYHRLGEPKTVIFVPSIKLATELAHTLESRHNLPATLYRDNKTSKTKDYKDLADAKILVTTLQTFSTKVYSQGIPMSEYGLVYVEESDQLISQFCRGGGGHFSSHVRENEARQGVAVLRDALAHSNHVLFVDATMSRVTYDFVEALSHNVSVVKNEYITKKAPVKFISSVDEAYTLILSALFEHKKVVFVADTRKEVDTLMLFMDTIDHDSKRIGITRTTERHPAVIQFMTDVNRYAQDYDLVAYNSVMASGVSITDVQPDVIIQICNYLTPRTNLQMLNRYRKQSVVYCLYSGKEQLYTKTQQQYYDIVHDKVQYEADVLNVPVAVRHDDAKLRTYISSISIADDAAQNRSPVTFYQSLLKNDGRYIVYDESVNVAPAVEKTSELIKEIKKQQKEYIANNWRKALPIDNNRPAHPTLSPLDVALGEAHAFIETSLYNNIPPCTNNDDYIYDVVSSCHKYRHILTAIINPDKGLTYSIKHLADKHKSFISLYNTATILSMVEVAFIMFQSLDDVIHTDTLTQRSHAFMETFIKHKDIYNLAIARSRQKYRVIMDTYETIEDKAIAFTKIILSKAGLKVRSRRSSRRKGHTFYEYYIANTDKIRDYIQWRSDGEMMLQIDKLLEYEHDDIISVYQNLSYRQQQRVLASVAHNMTYDAAIKYEKGIPEW